MENTMHFWTITQPKDNVYIMPIIFVIIFLLMITLMVGIIITIKNINISIKDNEIKINSLLYGRKIPIEDIMVNEIRTINLNENNEYKISIRTNGISLPNFLLGWMKLKNGNKALVYLTNKNNVLLIPTKDYVIMFSMDKGNEFIEKIKNK